MYANPKEANEYGKRFESEDVIEMIKKGITSSKANSYSSELYRREVMFLIDNKVSPEGADSYPKKFIHDLEILVEHGVSPETAKEYEDTRFRASTIAEHLKEIKLTIALRYDESFNGSDIARLYQAGIMPEEANKFAELNERYGTKIHAYGIITFSNSGIPFAVLEAQAEEKFLNDIVGR